MKPCLRIEYLQVALGPVLLSAEPGVVEELALHPVLLSGSLLILPHP